MVQPGTLMRFDRVKVQGDGRTFVYHGAPATTRLTFNLQCADAAHGDEADHDGRCYIMEEVPDWDLDSAILKVAFTGEQYIAPLDIITKAG